MSEGPYTAADWDFEGMTVEKHGTPLSADDVATALNTYHERLERARELVAKYHIDKGMVPSTHDWESFCRFMDALEADNA